MSKTVYSFGDYKDCLEQAITVHNIINNISLTRETEEMRLLVANISLNSGRLVKLLAKRVAGDVQEDNGE